jgi:hypothetical protein
MSGDETTTAAADNCCASCGRAELDDIALKECDSCDLVKYCSDACKEEHRPEHELMCKERAAKLRDELLFRQPEGTNDGDCPICSVPLPIDKRQSSFYSCCSKMICNGCSLADDIRQLQEIRQHPKCPFCRLPLPTTQEEADKMMMKRVKSNDPAALGEMGIRNFDEGNYNGAFEYWIKAAELGDTMAHYSLSIMYRKGLGVEKDAKKEWYHLEEAAIAGHPYARYNLALNEGRKGRSDRAVKHWIIAANLGLDVAMKELKDCYKEGF